MSFAGVCSTLLGLLSDFVKPQFHMLKYALLVAVIALIVSEIIRLRLPAPLGSFRSRWLARMSVSAGVGVIVLGVAWAADASIGGDRGIAAEVSNDVRYLQSRLLSLDETTAATLEVARRIEADTSRTAAAVNRMDERDRLLAASSLLERVASAKDLSDHGQVMAMEALAAVGRSFASMDLSGILLRDMKLPSANLADANLMMSDLGMVVIVSSNLAGANLRFAALDNADLTGTNMTGAKLTFVNAENALFNRVKGEGASFYATNLRGASFRQANLRGANFSFADLREADLEEADLTNAVLVGALMAGASLRGAIIANTELTGVAASVGTFSKSQWAGACRRPMSVTGTVAVSGALIVTIPNQRFRGGIEYSSLMDQVFNLPGLGEPQLPSCAFGTAARPQALEFGIRIAPELLSKADRRNQLVARVERHFATVGAALKAARAPQ